MHDVTKEDSHGWSCALPLPAQLDCGSPEPPHPERLVGNKLEIGPKSNTDRIPSRLAVGLNPKADAGTVQHKTESVQESAAVSTIPTVAIGIVHISHENGKTRAAPRSHSTVQGKLASGLVLRHSHDDACANHKLTQYRVTEGERP